MEGPDTGFNFSELHVQELAGNRGIGRPKVKMATMCMTKEEETSWEEFEASVCYVKAT